MLVINLNALKTIYTLYLLDHVILNGTTKKKREIQVTSEDGESKTYLIPYGSRMKVQDGQVLEAGALVIPSITCLPSA